MSMTRDADAVDRLRSPKSARTDRGTPSMRGHQTSSAGGRPLVGIWVAVQPRREELLPAGPPAGFPLRLGGNSHANDTPTTRANVARPADKPLLSCRMGDLGGRRRHRLPEHGAHPGRGVAGRLE